MANGRLEPPNLDDRLWQDLVDEAKALIPRYNSEWTDHNDTDLGITLIELFAWLVEGMIYRINRVPEKNFIEFLNLIGITRDPATPATVVLTYRLAGAASPLALPKGYQAATQQTGTDPALVFETDESVQLLPISLSTALHVYGVGPAKYKNVTANLVSAPLSGMSATIPAGQSITIALGFDLASALAIALRFVFPTVAKPNDLKVEWFSSKGIVAPAAWPVIPGVLDGTENFTQNGIATLTVPAGWTSQNPLNWPPAVVPETPSDEVQQPLFWIGIRVTNLLAAPFPLQISSILFNSIYATNALTVAQPELLGTSNGQPFQFFDLRNVPLFKRPGVPDPYDHAVLQVRTPLVGGAFGPWTTWTRVEDFPQGPGFFYRLDPVTGRINLGNHDAVVSPDGHGSIPPAEAEIRALTYRYVAGGAAGNVPPGTITVLRAPLPGLVGVTNNGSAANGSDEESIEDTKRRGPEALRNRYRAATIADYEYLAREATTDVKKVRCLPPLLFTQYDKDVNPAVVLGDPWTFGGLNRDTGNVYVIVIPGGPLSNPTPMPSAELLEEVTDYLEERRVVSTALTVTGPRYLPIKVTAQIKVWKKAVDTGLASTVREGSPPTRLSEQIQSAAPADKGASAFQRLQHSIGNQAVLRLLSKTGAAAFDSLAPDLARRKEPQAASAASASVPPIVNEVVRSPGQPLDLATRSFMEPRFGRDFSGVRLHSDSRAAESAAELAASAYTIGNHIVFGSRSTGLVRSERQLLAHELVHVVQQRQHNRSEPIAIGDSHGSAETEAQNIGTKVAAGINAGPISKLPGRTVQRQEDKDNLRKRMSRFGGWLSKKKEAVTTGASEYKQQAVTYAENLYKGGKQIHLHQDSAKLWSDPKAPFLPREGILQRTFWGGHFIAPEENVKFGPTHE